MQTTLVELKHHRLMAILEGELLNGRFASNEKLPTIRQLAKDYNISVNVASKAVKLLQKKGFVRSRTGDGIYSLVQTDKANDIPEDSLISGNVHALGVKKKIKVVIEDELDWQLEFWKSAVSSFVKDNPDIELEPYFGFQGKEKVESPDLIIGGIKFFNHLGYSVDDLQEASLAEEFHPGMYKDMLLSPVDLMWKNRSLLFPIFFQLPILLCHKNEELPESITGSGNIFEFIESIDQHSGSCAKYVIWDIMTSLVTCGCKYWNQETGEFKINNHELWTTTLEKYREASKRKDFLWYHNITGNSKNLISEIMRKEIKFIEAPSIVFRDKKLSAKIKPLPYSFKHYFPLSPICGFIFKTTRYVEESVRVINHFLKPEVQGEYRKQNLGFCLDQNIYRENDLGGWAENVIKSEKVFIIPPDRKLHALIDEIVSWEPYLYFTSNQQIDIIERINKKAEYYCRNFEN